MFVNMALVEMLPKSDAHKNARKHKLHRQRLMGNPEAESGSEVKLAGEQLWIDLAKQKLRQGRRRREENSRTQRQRHAGP
jgi:hypothetical protein